MCIVMLSVMNGYSERVFFKMCFYPVNSGKFKECVMHICLLGNSATSATVNINTFLVE